MNQQVRTRYLGFFHGITTASARALMAACLEGVGAGCKRIYIVLFTGGGDVGEGFLLYNFLRSLPVDVVIHNIGNVDSIGNVIFLAGKERYATSNATFMFHGVGFDITQPVRMERKNLTEMLDGVTAHTTRMAATIVAHAKFRDTAEVDELFLQASTKDAAFAKLHDIIHDIRDFQIPAGEKLIQVPGT